MFLFCGFFLILRAHVLQQIDIEKLSLIKLYSTVHHFILSMFLFHVFLSITFFLIFISPNSVHVFPFFCQFFFSHFFILYFPYFKVFFCQFVLSHFSDNVFSPLFCKFYAIFVFLSLFSVLISFFFILSFFYPLFICQ